ncbi:glutathione peroxidase [Actinophytocola glycyrrhizae]|uniref:Glutathione peroxidase n=1 Tax=Actinophytocola glycyrrhizae TaxID=2044873 RepID=A0ABV9RRV9_9PSEU
MPLHDIPLQTLDGSPATLAGLPGRVFLIVNVASKCGLTPQYRGLEALHERYADQGLSVVGFPCDQFGGQEPGSAEEIRTFCATNYGVTFPMMAKTEVNGGGRHPLYAELVTTGDADGEAGDVQWNFEKFLVDGSGAVTRFRPGVTPEDPALVTAVEKALAA